MTMMLEETSNRVWRGTTSRYEEDQIPIRMFPLCSALWEKLGNWCPRWNADVETVREERNGRILHVGLGLETLIIPGVGQHATVRSLSLVTHSSVTSPSICEFGIPS